MNSDDTSAESVQRTLSILDGLPVTVWIKNREMRFTFVNRAFSDLVKAEPSHLIGRTDYDLFSAKDASKFAAGDKHVFETNAPLISTERTSSLPDGRKFMVHVTKFPLQDTSGKIVGIVGISVDASQTFAVGERLPPVLKQLRELQRQLPKTETEFIEQIVHALESLFPKVALGHLQVLAPAFVGRERELATLDQAWNDSEHTHLVEIAGLGGAGKTSLLTCWLERLRKDNWRGAQAVFAWNFYDQGASDERVASSDLFLTAALEFFGDPDSTAMSSWEKGKRLAEFVRARRTLLILDGMETVQYPSGPDEGHLQQSGMHDAGIGSFMRELVRGYPGLCVVSSRLPLRGLETTGIKRLSLANLPSDAGAELLRRMGVKGTSKELQDAVHQFEGHALSLTLLGNYLVEAHKGDVKQLHLISLLERSGGNRMEAILKAHADSLAGKPEFEVLLLLGALDGPIDEEALAVLRRTPAIPGLTEQLTGLTASEWASTSRRLRHLALIASTDPTRPDILDCHPLIRQYFTKLLQERFPGAADAVKQRLHDYYNRRAGPLRLYVDLEEYKLEEVVEIIEGLSELYESMTGDRLVIDNQGMVEPSQVPEPAEA